MQQYIAENVEQLKITYGPDIGTVSSIKSPSIQKWNEE